MWVKHSPSREGGVKASLLAGERFLSTCQLDDFTNSLLAKLHGHLFTPYLSKTKSHKRCAISNLLQEGISN